MFVDKIVKEEVQVPVEKVVAGASEKGSFREVLTLPLGGLARK